MNPQAYQLWYGELPYPKNVTGSQAMVNLVSSGVPRFRMAILPRVLDVDSFTLAPKACGDSMGQDASNPLGGLSANSTMLDCRIFDSTYHVTFTYNNGNQDIGIDVPETDQHLIDYLPSSLLGPNNATCLGLNDGASTERDGGAFPCQLNSTALRYLSYRALVESLLSQIGGSVGRSDLWVETPSRITETALIDTYELSFLADDPGPYVSNTLQMEVDGLNRTHVLGGMDDAPNREMQPFVTAVERMFQSLAVSLLSEEQFR